MEGQLIIDDKVFVLIHNESIYKKESDIHWLVNDRNQSLIIIEAQVGSYTKISKG